MKNDVEQSRVKQATQHWVERVVIGLNLCPFAKREWVRDKVRIVVTEADTSETLIQKLVIELALLTRRPEIETTLLIHPNVLTDFDEYNQFLTFADAVVAEMQLEGEFQIASFHPDYQFNGTSTDDPENFTNRSPFPMLHLLREASLERVIEAHPDTQSIPQANIDRLRSLGSEYMQALLNEC